ncbi:MAG: AAA-like domain-containing protein [Thermodesulfobacteriota bacterium]|nr:AAA-like domain-containing protein [Thermodesulfobacteriota bacterium]
MRFFNTAGPVNDQKHYCISPLQRFDLFEIETLIAQEKYFVMHAPRQTGKTSCMQALVEHLNVNSDDRYRALYCNVETAQTAREDVGRGIKSILAVMAESAVYYMNDDFLAKNWADILSECGEDVALKVALSRFCHSIKAPLILLLDEIDSLVGDTLISVLRQIRSGYIERPKPFPQAMILCGVRDVRDYRIHSSRNKEIITGGSCFNIKAESLRLGDFAESEVKSLLEQHTSETGQEFTLEAKACIWHLSQGQPWLVNALAYESTFKIKEGRVRTKPVDKDMVDQAKENLITRRETHLDQLADKLQEERVRKVVEGILCGWQYLAGDLPEDDIQYVADLGLIRRKPQMDIANPIYREIVPRMLTSSTQDTLNQETSWYVKSDSSLDIDKLIAAFQEFFQEHSEHWLERFQYKEAGPQLLLQAFLQRIINSGGRIEREYGRGSKRIDLLVLWPLTQAEPGKPFWTRWQGPVQKVVIELKILHNSMEKTLADGLVQTHKYMDNCGTDQGHLIIFNRSPKVSWDEKIFQHRENFHGKKIMVWGM